MARALIGRMVETPHGSVHVQEDGPGSAQPIVLVHGYTGSMRWYDDMAALLSDTFRVVRLDLLGHGSSDRAKPMDGPAQAAMLTDLLDILDLKDVVVVGHSFGNDACLGAARTSPRVSAVVILGQGVDQSEVKVPPAAHLIKAPLLGWLLHQVTILPMLKHLLRPTFGPDHEPSREFWALAFRDYKAMSPAGHRVILVDRFRQLGENPLDAQLVESGLPGLAILGRHDCFYPWQTAEARYAAAGAKVVVLDTGHNVPVEAPREVADLIRGFATRLP